MQWDNDYTTAVAELKKQVKRCWEVQSPEVKIHEETTVFLQQ